MKKDYKKILRDLYYSKPYRPVIVTVPELNYLMISGEGYPEEEPFQLAAQTLFPIAYVRARVGPYHKPMEQTFGILKEHLSTLNYDWEPDSHDVYFNDVRRTPEEKLKTLIRVRIWQKNSEKRQLENPFVLWGTRELSTIS